MHQSGVDFGDEFKELQNKRLEKALMCGNSECPINCSMEKSVDGACCGGHELVTDGWDAVRCTREFLRRKELFEHKPSKLRN